jgi:hypothetical protein
MKIEHKNLVAKAADMMRYEGALVNMSVKVDAERFSQIAHKAMQTQMIVSNRIDTLLSGLDDDEMSEVMLAALDVITEVMKLDTHRAKVRNEKLARRAQLLN